MKLLSQWSYKTEAWDSENKGYEVAGTWTGIQEYHLIVVAEGHHVAVIPVHQEYHSMYCTYVGKYKIFLTS